jgi:alkyldihydroxyacetonephosphate synthase
VKMARRRAFQPPWREGAPAPGTYRAVFEYPTGNPTHPSAGWVEMFQAEFGMSDDDFSSPQAVGDQPVRLSQPPRLDPVHRQALAALVGVENVADDDFSRVRYGHGQTVDEDLSLRHGLAPLVPDLVVHPRHKEDVVQVVRYCAHHRIPLIPYGAGSGTVLGTRADRGGVALVMTTHMNRVLAVNQIDQTAVVQPGILGPDYEAALNDAPRRFGTSRAFTGGHFPQSFELASVGGWISALGSGQASTYYGDAYDLVVSQEYVTPAGTVRTHDYPAAATGPKVNDILKGSEGTFGVLVEATLKIYRYLPGSRRRFAFLFPDWASAADAAREMVQGEFGLPAVLRISDPEETERGLRLKGFDRGPAGTYMRLRGFHPMSRCLCIGTAEGEPGYTRHTKAMAARVARRRGAMSLTGFATRQWERGRYSDAHLREDLLDFGLVIDTLETAVTWSGLDRVYRGVRALAESRPHTICMTHASHFYPQGTNLYFIFIVRPQGPGEYFTFRRAVVDRIVECGGSISHHHGIGRLFAPWMEAHLGEVQLGALRALKAYFDPGGIMNPGSTLGLGPPQQ